MISKRGLNLARMKAESDYDALTTFRGYGNTDCRYKYDKNIEKVETIEYIGCNFAYAYQKLHRILTVASRDLY